MYALNDYIQDYVYVCYVHYVLVTARLALCLLSSLLFAGVLRGWA